ncbi:MAG: orotidine-5'-phosphate decarboxylase [Bacilli bacterium]|nr:orotidine-5'-phosphate decarboxylase [Bacilli bacterium]
MAKDVIIACDFKDANELINFLDKFDDQKLYLKVGMELFYSEGPSIIKEIKKRGHKIFLDLKLHDIPNTVKKAMMVLRNLDVDMVNIHAAGTINMMEAALEGLTKEDGSHPLLIAVTQLTSTSEETMQKELLINHSLKDVVKHYALNAKKAKLDGIVCSPLEAKEIHEACGNDFVTVTPGIRLVTKQMDDQVRITTPKMAKELGSDYIVVGRPITAASDPKQAYIDIYNEFMK